MTDPKWHENPVTDRVVDIIESIFRDLQVAGPTIEKQITCSCWKQSGAMEEKYGDVVFLLDIAGQDGVRVVGCSFLEAKIKQAATGNYDEIEREPSKKTQKAQLEYIKENTRYPHLLLYSREPIVSGAARNNQVLKTLRWNHENSAYWRNHFWRQEGFIPEDFDLLGMHAAVLPLPLALQIRQNIKTPGALEQRSSSLSSLICQRFLHGFDLDFDQEVVDGVLGYQERTRPARYLVRIAVGNGGYPPPPLDRRPADGVWTEIERTTDDV